MSLWSRLLRLLVPAVCLGCGAIAGEPLPLALCRRCRGRIPAPRTERCAGCGRELLAAAVPAGYRCGDCAVRPAGCDRVVALGAYLPPLVEVVAGLKFGRLEFLGDHVAAALVAGHGELLQGGELVVPVPLHWRRRLLRGYDQAEAIARPLAVRLGLPFLRALRRTRATPPQSELDRAARRRNLRGAFCVVEASRVRGRRILLVDDVVTTGVTIETVARVLRRAGAAAVTAVALARTPLR